MRALLLSLVVAAAVAAVPAPVPAPGGMTLAVSPVLGELSGRMTVRMSPDGRQLYFLGGYDARTSLAIVQRDPRTGKLWRAPEHDACVITWIAGQKICRNAPAFNNSVAMAVAPDGRNVVVGGYHVAQLAVFRPTPAGGLALASCVGVRNGGFPCKPARALGYTVALEFSPDGRTLYAGMKNSEGLAVFARKADGTLTQLPGEAGCIQRSERPTPESPPCATVPDDRFMPTVVRVLPGGKTVLVVSDPRDDPGLFVFRRNVSTGALTFLSCFTKRALPPCKARVASDPRDVAVAADGTLYSVGTTFDPNVGPGVGHVDVLHLDPKTGALRTVACFSTKGGACRRLPLPPGAEAAALAPDGRTLYVGGLWAIRAYRVAGATLARVPTTAGCASAVLRTAGCALLAAPDHFYGFHSLAVTPDGRDLFAAGYTGLDFRIANRP